MVSRDTDVENMRRQGMSPSEIRQYLETEVLKDVLNTWQGRYVIYSIICMGDLYDDVSEIALDHAQSQRQLGKRDLALAVLKQALTVKPKVYTMMQSEAFEFAQNFVGKDLEDEDDDD